MSGRRPASGGLKGEGVRIAALSNPNLVNSNYRAYQPLAVLQRRGHELLLNERDRPIRPETLFEVDVVHMHRIATPEIQQLIGRVRQAGVGIVWDNDDDVTAVPRSNPLYARFGGFRSRDMRAGVRAMVRLADIVTTPSAVLADQYRELGAGEVRVLENYMPPEFAKVRAAKHKGVAIACLAALEHQVDYQELGLRDVLLGLLDAHPELRVTSFGLGLGLGHERYEHVELVSFLDIAKTFSRFDIGIAPLVDIPWNRARSNVKLKEYASGGIAWLASPVGPYAGMGEREGGRLVPDDGWHAALERLIANGRERRKLAKRAARWVDGEGIEQHADRWEAALRDAVGSAAARARDRAV
jgi:glycosyltransferase involved in cell wall biosynthesis